MSYLKVKFYRAYYRMKLYKKHKQKIIKDSYTPQSIKFQILSSLGVVISLLLSIFYSGALHFALLFSLLFLLLTLPFLLFVLKRNIILGFFSPIIVLLRSIVFLLGIIVGVMRW